MLFSLCFPLCGLFGLFGQGHQTQISKEELTFRMTLFVAMMKAERVGTDEADVAVRPICQIPRQSGQINSQPPGDSVFCSLGKLAVLLDRYIDWLVLMPYFRVF